MTRIDGPAVHKIILRLSIGAIFKTIAYARSIDDDGKLIFFHTHTRMKHGE